MYQAYRCEVCGEVYLGTEKPEECPFCGAHKHFLKSIDIEEVELLRPEKISEKSRENVKSAMGLEVGNASFYFSAASQTRDEHFSEAFERLGKIEDEHASALAKLGSLEKSSQPDVEASEELMENLRESHRREERAIQTYRNLMEEAPEEDVGKFFKALAEIEEDHLNFSERNLEE